MTEFEKENEMVVRQPNGLLCLFPYYKDCPTQYNMTKEEYFEYGKEKYGVEIAKDILENHVHPFEEMLMEFMPYNMSMKRFNSILKEMGYDKEYTYPELEEMKAAGIIFMEDGEDDPDNG